MNDQNTIDCHWMSEALSLARQAAAVGEVPVGAVLVGADNQVIGRGWNRPISGCDPTAHAEILALREGAEVLQNYRLLDTTLYVTIEPCAMCAGAMIHARIKRLVFAAAEPKAGVAVSNLRMFEESHLNHYVELTQGVLAEDASSLISNFFAGRRAAQKAGE